MLQRYLDAGIAFTEMSRAKAEEFVKDLVKAGEIRQKEAQSRVDELVERSRKNTEQLLERSRKNTEQWVETVRSEITAQLSTLGLATKEDIARLERLIGAGSGSGAVKKAAAPAKKAAAKKAPAKKSPAKAAAKKA